MSRWVFSSIFQPLFAIVAIAALALPARAQAQATADPAPAAVNEAIRRGVKELYNRRKPGQMWEPVPYDKRVMSAENPQLPVGAGADGGQWGGTTALVVYTLLAAGEDPNKPELAEAIEWLVHAPVVGTYAVGMRMQVWLSLPPKPEYQAVMRRDWQLLGEAIQGNNTQDRLARGFDNRNAGLFDYLPPETPRVDLSASQYGVLGLWSAAQYGHEVPPEYWQAIETAWLRWQQPNGGWAYNGEPNPDNRIHRTPTSMSMTTAGVASLFITQDFLHAGEGIRCNGNIVNPAIDRGMAFLIEGFPYLLGKKPSDGEIAEARASLGHRYYTLYGIERIGVASGLKYFGELNWYAEGARWLLSDQRRTGSWGTTPDTCFALIFLSHGRQPVYMNKLAYFYDDGETREVAAWNQRPRDVANLARYVNRVDERRLNWQTIHFGAFDSAAEATRELHDAPVTYLAGSRPLAFNDAEMQALKDYVLQGGLILANADCGRRPFAESFIDLGEQMFADEGYEFRVLPDDHPIYTEQKFDLSQMRRKPRLLGLSNGVRELMILIQNEDLARDWQLFNQNAEESFQIGTNIFLYAIDKSEMGYKGITHLIDEKPGVSTNRTIKVARLKYDGNWNPEPAGWDRLAAVMHNEHKIDLQVTPVDPVEEDLAGYDVAHLTGTGETDLAEALAPERLRQFVENGGTLFIDAAGGDGQFAQSVTQLLHEAFPEQAEEAIDVLPTTHAVYAAAGEPIKEVDYRSAARRILGAEDKPRLRGITIDDRLAVIVSNEDISNGLVGAEVSGVVGYAPADATRLAESILLYAAK